MKIALHGYGKMGRMIDKVARERGHEIAAVFDRTNAINDEKLGEVDVFIEFSNAGAIDRVVASACRAKINLVIGTTGWNDRLQSVRQACTAA
ncbi:MAG TPA: 4-hydroxy-tetrahydrodipicolinate reductase, partial [Thermoanaerobaculia bacterium]